ncbi:helix-turn-helix transcriptional regulator [Kutzneria sp. 744]|uniref:helix-turn-helix domain-containing protein n=1 Tax=Kutzneria sp. (strain 744) TaxID=345341 RepID=UPI0003EEA7A8|nr:helix-turn-helix transcriptional regulator [Kutzneria sp. 744]EWM19830.1 LuxR-family transcriptional regulator [Kutzneria sp. 744]
MRSSRPTAAGAGATGTTDRSTNPAPGSERRNPIVRVTVGPQAATLAPREFEVLQLMADGWPNEAIANYLGFSGSTVKTTVGRMFEKLGAENRVQAVTTATVLGVICLSDARRAEVASP